MPLSTSKTALLFDQPLKGDVSFPRAGNKRPVLVPSDAMIEAERGPIGKVCSRAFFVTSFGSVIVFSCIHEI
jgi:hypothetical protein